MDSSMVYTTETLVETAKNVCDIRAPSNVMADSEVREVCREIAEDCPDTYIDKDGRAKPGPIGIGLMLFIALTEFPEFYERWELAQFN